MMPMMAQIRMNMLQIFPTRGTAERSPNRFTTKPWLRWNLAPCLSHAKYAMRKPIHVIYASTPVALVEMLPDEP